MPRLAASTISIRSTLLRRRALQLVDRTARLVGDPLAVDEHVLGRLAEAAVGRVDRLDGEARHLGEHVVGGLRRETREVGGRVDALGAGDCERRAAGPALEQRSARWLAGKQRQSNANVRPRAHHSPVTLRVLSYICSVLHL